MERDALIEAVRAIYTEDLRDYLDYEDYVKLNKYCCDIIRRLRPCCEELGSAIHTKYLEMNAHIRAEAPHLAVPFDKLPRKERLKDYDIAIQYYTFMADKSNELNAGRFAESFAENTHIKWLEGYRAAYGNEPRVRDGVRIDVPWEDLPIQRRQSGITLANAYLDMFNKHTEKMVSLLMWADKSSTEKEGTVHDIYGLVREGSMWTTAWPEAHKYHFHATIAVVLRDM